MLSESDSGSTSLPRLTLGSRHLEEGVGAGWLHAGEGNSLSPRSGTPGESPTQLQTIRL